MNTKPRPQNPLQALTSADPYPYYRELVARRPLYYDEALGMWVASSAEAVAAVLSSEICRVRPTAEPVPKALLESAAGEIFGHLVRMNDGPKHATLKQAISAVLTGIDRDMLRQISHKWADKLLIRFKDEPASWGEFAFQLPAHVIGDLLGIPDEQLDEVSAWIEDFVRCLSPLSTPTQIEEGKEAAKRLLELASVLLASESKPGNGLLIQLKNQAASTNDDWHAAIAANGIGFLSQAYEATAALITSTLLNLARHPEILERAKANGDLLSDFIQEVLRSDAPVQNTRRYLAEDGIIAGQEMKAGDGVLVLLAAANHDPNANPTPERFELSRLHRHIFTFGRGVHACPGQTLAQEIAEAGVRQWIRANHNLSEVPGSVSYQELVNIRMPLFTHRSK